jgi:hypothetical protein
MRHVITRLSRPTAAAAFKVPGRWAAVLGIAALVALGATPAQATVVSSGHFQGSDSADNEDLCGIAVHRDSVFSGSFRVRVDKASGGQAFFQRLTADAIDVFTNAANGASMSIESKELTNEIAATQVEGNEYEFTTIEAGQPLVVRDSAGNVVLRDRGVIRHHVLFDTLGDGTPGGITLDDEILAIGGPHPGLAQTDQEFCAMVTTLIG